MAIIEVKNLSVVYPGSSKFALENVSFQIESGKIVLVMGPNGCGKTTLLKALIGLVEYTGSISFTDGIKGQDLQIGYVPQKFEVDASLPITVEEFLFLSLTTCSHPQKEKQTMVKTILKKVGATKLVDRQLSQLSGGEFQRVLLARALVHQPHLLILDEPEAGVDATGEKIFYDLLVQLMKEDGLTVILASHELELVKNYADWVICLNKKLVCSGEAKSVLNQEVFNELYGTGFKLFAHKH